MDFSYILEKIESAVIAESPYRHLEISNLFEEHDFRKIIDSPEVTTPTAYSDESLFDCLFSSGYRIIEFPGCTRDHRDYLNWHKDKKPTHETGSSCEGFGVVLRLEHSQSEEMIELNEFVNSSPFVECIARKFDVSLQDCKYDAGIQKYLDGYEISPHPDIRKKALTYMVNINPNPAADTEEHHTSYLKFKPEWAYVQSFWQGNPRQDRCWVPWHWCEIVKQQRSNNSIVIFSPDNDTLHGVKANYNHLAYQRTQIYGNLWLKRNPADSRNKPRWEDYLISKSPGVKATTRAYLRDLKRELAGKRKKNCDAFSTATHSDRKY